MTNWHKATAILAAALVIVCGLVGYGYFKSELAKAKLEGQVQVNNQDIAKARIDNVDIDTRLVKDVTANANARKSVKTPKQAADAMSTVFDVPESVHSVTAEEAASGVKLHEGDMITPAISVKPLFDIGSVCRDNVLKLNACTESRVNDQTIIDKQADTIKQQDIVIKGGTKTQRVLSAGKWILVGAAGLAVVETVASRK